MSLIFKQIRIGKHGKPFIIYKFRTMRPGNELELPVSGIDSYGHFISDSRITKVGKFLRKTGIDETPQVWNPLIGDISLVGICPQEPRSLQYYSPEFYELYIQFKPGLLTPSYIGHFQSFSSMEKFCVQYMQQKLRYGFFIDFLFFWKILYGLVILRTHKH